jgi:hypothetical protein
MKPNPIASLVLVVFLLAGCSAGSHIRTFKSMRSYAKEHREDRDLSTERLSEKGLFRVSFEPQTEKIPLRKLHAWTLRVQTPDSARVDSAAIAVDGGMPEHGHGLPTRPEVTRSLGDGRYLIEGMKFQMPGWWIVRFEIASVRGTDTITFNLML